MIRRFDDIYSAENHALRPSLYIIILNWNQWQLTAECIRSLQRVDYDNLHLVVIDNGSIDDSVEKLRDEFGQEIILILTNQNLGYAGGNNIGIQYAIDHAADYVMVLNNDTIVQPDFIFPLLARLQQQKNIGVVTPKIYFLHQPQTIWAVGGKINRWQGHAGSRGRGELDTGQYNHPQPVAYTTGCCFLAYRTVFQQVGGFDEKYFAYFEDTDWSQRVWEKGWEIWYEPTSVIWHVAGGSAEKNNSKSQGTRSAYLIYLLTRNNLWFIQSHIKGITHLTALITFFIKHVLFYSIAYLLLFRFAKLKSMWKGVYDGLARASFQKEF